MHAGAGTDFPKAVVKEKHEQIYKSSFPTLFSHSMAGCLLPQAHNPTTLF